ncbi:MAG: NADH-quinone oxidoreductase subunit A [Oligoflexia bacterium]|nr:NADH-quinone oxidoreductase subunit A [Oligoflexia bacterium]
MLGGYISLMLFLGAILLFIVVSLVVNFFLEPKGKQLVPALSEPFECGTPQLQQQNTTQIPISYYKVAIIFVLFDLETIFLFLWAMGSPGMSNMKFFTFILFMLIFTIIFIYVINQKILDFNIRTENK